MQVTDHRGTFVNAFAEYVQWVLRTDKDPAPKAKMLKAFSAFLDGERIGMDNARHFELLASMTAMAGQTRGGGPPNDPTP